MSVASREKQQRLIVKTQRKRRAIEVAVTTANATAC